MKVIIIGCGRLGSGMARDLSRRGNQVTVIDIDPLAFEKLGKGLQIKTVTGIGFDRNVLKEAGIESADSLAAVTASDEANVVAARIAKMVFRVPRVGARVYDPRKAEIYRRLGIPTISPVAITAMRMSELLTFPNLNTLIRLGTGEVSVVEIEANDLLAGRTIEDLGLPGKGLVISITRMGKSFIPSAKTPLEYGDVVHLAVMADDTDRIASLLG
jgi:trk system potassium uptake protein TrkA